MEEYIKSSHDKAKAQHFLWKNRINVYNAEALPEDVNIEEILEDIGDRLPSSFFNGIESIFIGEFEHMREKEVDAMFQDGAIYIYPPYVRSSEDLEDDLVHEIAHSLEEAHMADIYGDGKLEREFLLKRMQLLGALKKEDVPHFPRDYFLNVDYSLELDNYLYRVVGYPLLAALTTHIFASPYGATSLREYFANGFEEYYMRDPEAIKSVSPQLYKKIVLLYNNAEES